MFPMVKKKLTSCTINTFTASGILDNMQRRRKNAYAIGAREIDVRAE